MVPGKGTKGLPPKSENSPSIWEIKSGAPIRSALSPTNREQSKTSIFISSDQAPKLRHLVTGITVRRNLMKTLQSCPGLTTKQWDLVDQQKNIPPEQWTRAHDREVCFQQKERQNFPRDLGGVSFLPIWASFLTKSYWIAKEIHLAQPLPLTQYTQKSHPWLKENENKKTRRVYILPFPPENHPPLSCSTQLAPGLQHRPGMGREICMPRFRMANATVFICLLLLPPPVRGPTWTLTQPLSTSQTWIQSQLGEEKRNAK